MSTRGRSLRRSSSTGRRSDTVEVQLRSRPRSVVIGLVRHPHATSSTSTHVAYSPYCYGRCAACVCDGLTACKNAKSVFDQALNATVLIGTAPRHAYRWRAIEKGWPGFENPCACLTTLARRRHPSWRRRAIRLPVMAGGAWRPCACRFQQAPGFRATSPPATFAWRLPSVLHGALP